LLPLSLYIHIPWCLKKCPYCDFNSHAIKSDLPEKAYVECLLNDLALDITRFQIQRPLQSIFIGGGTPSLFSPASLSSLLEGIAQQLTFEADIEITLEANPGTFEYQKFAEYRAIGINRLSIGIQSFHDEALQALGRVHSADNAKKAAEMANTVGFDNVNLDLMFGLPQSTFQSTLKDVETAMALQPTHLSFYQLTLEPNTYFHRYPPTLPAEDAIFSAQLACQEKLAAKGYRQYEVSAYSLEGKQCRHNLNYWQFGDYLGIGAGAHGKISLTLPNQIIRTQKNKHPDHYQQLFIQDRSETTIAYHELPFEFLMNHLRLKQGFTIEHFQQVTGMSIEIIAPILQDCIQDHLIQKNENTYRCSAQGWNFVDDILQRFIP
jgi:oxygen-independent coproporphyrinogen-3 oxidase